MHGLQSSMRRRELRSPHLMLAAAEQCSSYHITSDVTFVRDQKKTVYRKEV